MTKSKLIAAIGASTLILTGVVATTAAAQPGRYYDRGYDNDDRRYDRGYERQYNRGGYNPGNPDYNRNDYSTSRVDALEWRINNAQIPNGQRRALLNEWRQIQPLAYRVQTGQASRWEYNRLVQGVRRIEQATVYVDAGQNRRYGYNRR